MESKKTIQIILILVVLILFSLFLLIFGTKEIFKKNADKVLLTEAEYELLQFDSNLQKEMQLALQMAKSPLIVSYFKNPDDRELFQMAKDEIASYQSSFLSKGTFWINDNDLTYYIDGNPQYVLDKSEAGNQWYINAMNNSGKYVYDVNYEKALKKTFLWLDAIVRDENGKSIGLIGSGIPLTDFVNIMYSKLQNGLEMYLYDEENNISGAKDASLLENDHQITEVVPELKDRELRPNESYFFTTRKGEFLVVPIAAVDWHIVLFKPFDFYAFISSCAIPAVVILILFIIFFIAGLGKQIIAPLKLINATISEISLGKADLSRRINVKTNGTLTFVKRLVESFNVFMEKLQQIIKEVKESKEELLMMGGGIFNSAENTSESIKEISENIENLSNNIQNQILSVLETSSSMNQISINISSFNKVVDNQASIVTEASVAVEQMLGNISSVNSSIEKLSDSFVTLENGASNGVLKQSDVNTRIEQIREQSQMLQNANQIISSIAEQTNLLSMNAAIEAAHAGEAGKGFSVVADEIRKLSETSSEQSKTIGSQLNTIQESIENIVGASSESLKTFSNLTDGIKNTDTLVKQISTAMSEQNEGSKQINKVLEQLKDLSARVGKSFVDMKNISNSVTSEVRKLEGSSQVMKNGMEQISESTERINEQGNILTSLAKDMSRAIDQISTQIDQFKV